MAAYERQLNHFVNIKMNGNNIIERIYAKYMPAPFMSLVIDDCIKNGTDYNAGGARYNTNYIQGVGLGSITDELTAIKFHVYDNENYSWKEMMKAIKSNFEGYEKMQHELVNKTPKYGNDDDYADDQARMIFEMYFNDYVSFSFDL